MNTTEIVQYEVKKSLFQFKHFDYLKLACDIFFCLVKIYKLFIHDRFSFKK